MRKIHTSLLTIALAFSLIPVALAETEYPPYYYDSPFKDTRHGVGAGNDITFLYKKNIIGGYPDGTFRPNEAVTRAQVASMLLKALDIPLLDHPTVTFKDVSKQSIHYKALATVNEKGILRGDDGYMRAGEAMTRAQMAAVLRRAYKLKLEEEAIFIDVTPLHWAYGDISSVTKNGIAGGYRNGTFRPGNPVTRGQFSSFLTRALDDKMKLSGYATHVSQKGTVVEYKGFSYTIKGDQLIRTDLKTKKEEVVLADKDFLKKEGVKQVHVAEGFPISIKGGSLYVPYWAEVDQAGMPTRYGVWMVGNAGPGWNGIYLEEYFADESHTDTMRNVSLHGFDYYYTVEKKKREFDSSFTNIVGEDQTLILYHKDVDVFKPKKVMEFDARVLFEPLAASSPHKSKVTQNNKSVKFDTNTMYYFNKNGVYSYGLLTGQTKRLSTVLAKEMEVSLRTVEVVDLDGKKHSLKK
ncbi:hypothetical protein CSV63_09230 [Sporosarcina sp. P34]|uniref:S-layer homology domain-containing protein n=1 Tax=Sporosarcina sp. P34 TaxID=2048247 RepID=UPI000C16EF82|nr:S-layer homology domain-containing protein [Sporosarcina sp. P34]PID14973.1 hypothetical protein CSV63_09230 [Sporosarcina sp. P34]